jgi:predicted nucleic acid binding AN1-type Zn finger protein
MTEVEKLCRLVRTTIITLVFIGIAVYVLDLGRDSTDQKGYLTRRSGLSLLTDNLTGCQYLSKGGSLIARVDANGNHICEEKK